MQFAEAFPDEEIVATVSRQLSWSHIKELLPLGRPHQREDVPHRGLERENAPRAG